MNMAEAKYTMDKTINRKIKKPVYTSKFHVTEADSDYEKKKEAEHKAIHDEIKRVSLQQSLI